MLGIGSQYNSFSSPKAPAAFPLAFYLKAGVGVTTVSGAVSQWNDSSGSGDANKNATQGTAGNRPTYNTTDAAYNNQPTLSFAKASTQFLKTGVWASALAQPLTVFFCGQTDMSSTQGLFDDSQTATNCTAFVNTTSVFQETNAGANGIAIGQGVTVVQSPCLIVAVFNRGTYWMTVNGVPLQSGPGNVSGTGLTGLLLGGFGPSGSSPLNGKVYEVGAISRALSLTEADQLHSYYKSIVGIP